MLSTKGTGLITGLTKYLITGEYGKQYLNKMQFTNIMHALNVCATKCPNAKIESISTPVSPTQH